MTGRTPAAGWGRGEGRTVPLVVVRARPLGFTLIAEALNEGIRR